jgi:hypothetical protein
MKYVQQFSLLAIMALTLSVTALAADTHSGKFTLSDTVQLGATQLRPGDYKAEWSGPSNALKVDILQHGKTVATADGEIKDLQYPARYNSVTLKPAAENQKTIDEIDFSNRTEAIVINGE